MKRVVRLLRHGGRWGTKHKLKVASVLVVAFVLVFAIGSIIPWVSYAQAVPVVALIGTAFSVVYAVSSEPETGGNPDSTDSVEPPLDRTPERSTDIPDPVDEPTEVLNQQGFERLTGREFRNRRVDRESCWRREFNFTEVAQRIPIDRQRASEGYPSVTDELLDDLSDGGAAVLIGDPGAGKTTTTRMVAHRWHTREETGPVLYRQHRNESVTHPDTLATAIEEVLDDSPILVVVEDLPLHQTLPFVEVLHALEPDDNISLLLNSRTREWDSLDERARRHDGIDTSSKRGTEVVETPSRYPERREMPALHSNEIRRLKEQFERETGRTVHADAEELAAIIFETEAGRESTVATAESQTGLEAGQSESQPTTNAGHGVSPLLLLMYHFPVGGVDVEAGERETALHENVSRIYRRINGPKFDEELRSLDADDELLGCVALLANVMNAAEVPLHRRLFDALADTEGEIDTIEDILDELDGLLFFGIEDEEYLFHHPIWSQLYLKELIEKEESSRKQFETVVNALFRFAAANQVRTGQQSVVDRLVSSVFALCEEYSPTRAAVRHDQ